MLDEQKVRAQAGLIDQLLRCETGEEAQILSAHQELLDAELLMVMIAFAAKLQAEGQAEAADWLQNFAQQLAPQILGEGEAELRQLMEALQGLAGDMDGDESLPIATNSDGEIEFIAEILQSVASSQGNPQQVYPLFKANLAKLNEDFLAALPVAAKMFAGGKPDEAKLFIAATYGEFANLIQQFPLGNRALNMEIAIAAYEIAGNEMPRAKQPQLWATTQNNLASAYSDRIRGDRAENLEESIRCYRLALEVSTRADFPVDWATTQNNLAIAYSARIRGDRAENLEEAIRCCRHALTIFQPKLLPEEAARTGRLLGDVGFKAGDWAIAIEGYVVAIDAYETTRSWGSTESRRLEIQEEAISTYEKLIQSAINDGNLPLALATVERSRSKRLVDLMLTNDLYRQGQIPKNVQTLLKQDQQLQTELNAYREDNAAIELAGSGTRSGRDPRTKTENDAAIQQREQQRRQLRDQLSTLDPVAAELLQVSIPDLASLQKLVKSPDTALLSFYSTSTATHIFILKQHSLACHTCAGQDMATLNNWLIDNWVRPYAEINAGDTPQQRSQLRLSWANAIPQVMTELSHRLQFDQLLTQHLDGINELILVPHLYLHQIPFAVLPTSIGLLGEEFRLRQVPSTQILEFCQQRPPVTAAHHGTVEDATEDLPGSRYEGDQIAQIYAIPDQRRLRGRTQATVANYRDLLPQVTHLLSSHHAYSRLDNPIESRLMLADGSLSLADLLMPGFTLPNLSDVFLSCCETGLSFSQSLTDDPITLATGFLCAGARNVVSTLWAVDDIATALFSIRYHHHRQTLDDSGSKSPGNRPASLQNAQKDLRTLSGEDFRAKHIPKLKPLFQARYQTCGKRAHELRQALKTATTDEAKATMEQDLKQWNEAATKARDALDQLEVFAQQDYPFAHPIYWAGFVCQGIA